MADVPEITVDSFEADVLQAEKPVLVDFWAPWCGPCRVISPVVAKMADQYKDELTVFKLNVDDHPAIAQKYEIRGIPALLFFNGGEVVNTVVGAVPETVLEQHCQDVVNRA